MRPARTFQIVAPVGVLLVSAFLAACSVLLDKSKDQCTTNGECARFGATYQCVQNVCVAGGGLDAGPDGAPGGDAGSDACVPTPKTKNSDFYNEKCTNSSCIPFDNCAKLGICDGGLPALVTPPDGGV